MLVVPIVTDEFVSALLGMLVKVFDDPDIDLLVKICEPVSVATVLSMPSVFAADPSNVVPVLNCKPVPAVKALGVAAVIVPDPPNATLTPLYVTDELVSDELAMLLRVLSDPLIVLLVSV